MLALASATLQSSSCDAATTHSFATIPMPSFVMSNIDSFAEMCSVAADSASGGPQNCGDFAVAVFYTNESTCGGLSGGDCRGRPHLTV